MFYIYIKLSRARMDILSISSLRSLDSRGSHAGEILLSSICVKPCGFIFKSGFCSSIATRSFVVDLHLILSQMSHVSFVGKQRCSDTRRHLFLYITKSSQLWFFGFQNIWLLVVSGSYKLTVCVNFLALLCSGPSTSQLCDTNFNTHTHTQRVGISGVFYDVLL